jgi:hypothetical protein
MGAGHQLIPFSLERYHGWPGVSALGTGPWYGLGAKAAGRELSAGKGDLCLRWPGLDPRDRGNESGLARGRDLA